MKPPDDHLLRQVRDGNKKAFEALFHAYYSPLSQFACKFVDDADEAEEIVQDFFVALWEKRKALDKVNSPKSYLFSSIRNHCLNYIKHQKVRVLHQEHVKQTASLGDNSVEDYINGEELRGRIEESINSLPDRCREVFQLSRFRGLKYSEIAENMGISIKTVEVQMGKALKLLRGNLKDLLPVLLLLFLFLEKISDWIRVS